MIYWNLDLTDPRLFWLSIHASLILSGHFCMKNIQCLQYIRSSLWSNEVAHTQTHFMWKRSLRVNNNVKFGSCFQTAIICLHSGHVDFNCAFIVLITVILLNSKGKSCSDKTGCMLLELHMLSYCLWDECNAIC